MSPSHTAPQRYLNQRCRALSETWQRVADTASRVSAGYATARLQTTDLNELKHALTDAFTLQRHPNANKVAPASTKPPDADCPLTRRQLEILTLLANGRNGSQIAEELHLAVNTIKTHLSKIYRRLEAANSSHAVLIAVRAGLIQ